MQPPQSTSTVQIGATQGTAYGAFSLLNLETNESFIFTYFPERITQNRRVGWEPQDTFPGVKPLAYGNREPQRIQVQCWLDRSDAPDSISPDIDGLFALQVEGQKGQPPALLAVWGDRLERVVLEEVDVETELFTNDGSPCRARVRLGLLGYQEEITHTSVQEVEDDDTSISDPTVTNTGQTSSKVRVGPIP